MREQPVPTNPAEAYQAYMVPSVFEPWSHELLDRARLMPGEHVLDIACGTGVVSRNAAMLIGPEGAVTGLDPSPAMLDVARRLPALDGAPIEWMQGRAEELPFEDAAFDVVLCQQGVQFFSDRLAAFKEMRRVLRPGGRAGVSVWRGPEHQSVKGALLIALQEWFGPGALVPYSFGDAIALQALFADAGFRDVRLEVVRRQMPTPSIDEFLEMTIRGASAAVPALAKATDEERADAIRSIRQQIEPEIEAARVGEGIEFPMESHIVIAIA